MYVAEAPGAKLTTVGQLAVPVASDADPPSCAVKAVGCAGVAAGTASVMSMLLAAAVAVLWLVTVIV